MKKNFILFCLVLTSVFFTSCVDYVQSISYKNGKYKLYYKATLSKVLFAMSDENPDEIFKNFEGELNNFDDESLKNLPKSAKINPINTDLEVGAEFSFEIDPKTTDETEKSYLPKVSGKKCYIPFLIDNNNSDFSDEINSEDEESQAIIRALLSSAKCRVLIGKNIIPSIEIAYFEGTGGQNYSIPVFDYGDSYCLEIPFVILTTKMYNQNRIVVIRTL